MAVYFVQGKLGAGKSLTVVDRLRLRYLLRGRRVATNMDLFTEHLLGYDDDAKLITRLPDKPTAKDFEYLGYGGDPYDEDSYGAIALDECASWFNSRTWNDKDRLAVNDWMTHARKFAWDLYILVQDTGAIDAQARNLVMEHEVTCARLDRMSVPIIGSALTFLSLGTVQLKLPRLHIAKVFYTGQGSKPDHVGTWYTRGTEIFSCYDTGQIFGRVDAMSSVLPGRYHRPKSRAKRGKEFIMRLSRLYFRRLSWTIGAAVAAVVLCASLIAGVVITTPRPSAPESAAVEKPGVRVLPITSISSFQKAGIGGRSSTTEDIRIADGPRIMSITSLRLLGYSVRRISDCEYVLTRGPDRIETYCDMSPDLSGYETTSGTI